MAFKKTVRIYLTWLLVFLLEKPAFMLYYHLPVSKVGEVLWHGLSLDLAMSGYLTSVPAVILLVSVWWRPKALSYLMKGFMMVASFLVAFTFMLNLVLYGYWNFPLDSTPIYYFLTSPKDAFASANLFQELLGMIATFVLAYGIYWLVRWKASYQVESRPIRQTFLMIVTLGMLFLSIRGSVTVSSTNTGKAYFSHVMELNHAAVNPTFSLFESFAHQVDFGRQYRFMTDDQADKYFKQMVCTESDEARTLLRTDRPDDILLIIWEGFPKDLMTALGGKRNVAVEMDSLAHHAILFRQFYANSFRTDRGLVSVLSGYPAQPTTSLMKFPKKTESLPSIAQSLKRYGYHTSYYYGGDADFANMRSFLVSQGFLNIVSDVDFPISEKLSKWGVPDHLVAQRLMYDVKREGKGRHFRVFQTSSSHEPWDVPYHRLKDKRLNSFAYTDHTIGQLIRDYQKLPQWKNTLVIILADHVGSYLEHLDNEIPQRYQIPLIWAGGAITQPMRVDTLGGQIDLAATLLGQMNIPHHDFTFSKDMMSKKTPKFGYFTFPDLWGMATKDATIIYDNKSKKVIYKKGSHPERYIDQGKAFLQKLYDDIQKR